jgi:hypothetical protein
MTSLDKRFKRIVIWGHPLGSHTHSYIHAGFYKAFKYLGYETHWLDHNSDISGIDFSDTLFITEGQVDKGMPVVKDSYYLLHNASDQKIREAGGRCLFFQVYTSEVPSRGELINNHTVIENSSPTKCIYSCWATDLLPHEIDENTARNNLDDRTLYWVGSQQDNLEVFFRECRNNSINVQIIDPWRRPISFEENRHLVNNSFISPAIQSNWQVSVGYIPCRIFKNISYGHFGYTNSETVNSLFDGELIYSPDVIDLFYKSLEFKNAPEHLEKLKYLMNKVRKHHTYLNIIEEVIKFLPE